MPIYGMWKDLFQTFSQNILKIWYWRFIFTICKENIYATWLILCSNVCKINIESWCFSFYFHTVINSLMEPNTEILGKHTWEEYSTSLKDYIEEDMVEITAKQGLEWAVDIVLTTGGLRWPGSPPEPSRPPRMSLLNFSFYVNKCFSRLFGV